MHNHNARIDDVSTLPELQGFGYATSLIKYSLIEAKKLGVKYCFLESSASGFSIYQNLGFRFCLKIRFILTIRGRVMTKLYFIGGASFFFHDGDGGCFF